MPRFSLWLLLKMQVYTSRHYLAPYAPALDSAAHMFLLSRAAADAVVSCFGVNALVQNKSLHDSMMMVCFGDRETPSLFDAVIECATRILKSLGWEAGADASSACSATIYETLYMLSNNHLMSALNNCAAVVAWMCETIDGAAFVASDIRSVNLLTRICLTGCCMLDPQQAQFGHAGPPSFQALGCISGDARVNALHSAVGAMVALSRLISSEMLLSKSISDDSLLLASWRLANSHLTLQSPPSLSASGPDKMHENFLDIMYVAKFSQVGGTATRGLKFDFEDTEKRIVSAVQPTPAALRQVALAAYFEVILAVKDVRAESLRLAQNQDFTRRLGSSCASELRGLLCGLGWGVVPSLRVKGTAISRMREVLTAHLVAAGYHHAALVPLQNIERLLLPPHNSINGEFVEVMLQWRRCGHLIESYRSSVQPNDHNGGIASASPGTKGDAVALSLLCVVSILSPVLAGDSDCNFKVPSKFVTLVSSIQTIARYINCSVLVRTRFRLIAAANKIKYSAKRAVFNRYVASKLLAIVRVSQPESIWPVASKVCISWGSTAAAIAESAVKDWQTCRRHVKRMNTTTDRFYQGRTRLSMQVDPNSSGRKLVYTVPLTSPRVSPLESRGISALNADGTLKSKRAVSEKAARVAGRSWNISSSDSEGDGSVGDSDGSCDSLGDRSAIEKEDALDGTHFSSSRMYMVSELPINAFTSNSPCDGSAVVGGGGKGHDPTSPRAPAVQALDLSDSHYIEKQLSGHYKWGAQNSNLKCKYLQRQVSARCGLHYCDIMIMMTMCLL